MIIKESFRKRKDVIGTWKVKGVSGTESVKWQGESRYQLKPLQKTQNIRITFVQRRPNVFDVGPRLYKWYTNVLCLLCPALVGESPSRM